MRHFAPGGRPAARARRAVTAPGLAALRRAAAPGSLLQGMLLRIEVDHVEGVTVFRLHGGLRDEGLEEFQRAVAGSDGAPELDLAELRSVDEVSTAYLRGLVHAGVRVRRSNSYVATLLPPPRRAEA